MYQFQEHLPKLPLPKLEDTCKRYIDLVTPLLSETELERTKVAVREFQQGMGSELQKQLEMIDRSTNTNYLHELREDECLDDRLSCPFYRNVVMLVSPYLTTSKYSCTHVAATTIFHILRFYLKVKHGELEPDLDIYRPDKPPLCMAQYDDLFGISRIPGINRDRLQRALNPEHVVVIRRNAFYALKLLEKEEILGVEAIEQQLHWILENTPTGEPPLGVLTALNRTPWATSRSYIEALSPDNAHSLDVLDSALFIVCLDETTPTDPEAIIGNALHGGGDNRWYDKPIQLIFTSSGQLALHVGRGGFDGYAVMRLVGDLYRELQHASVPPTFTAQSQFQPPRRLRWSLDTEAKEAIFQASTTVERLIVQNQIGVLIFPEFGSEFIQKHGLFADAVVHLSLQLAYTRLHGELTSNWTSVHARGFRYGRTELAFLVTPESVELVRAFTEATSDVIKYNVLKRAVMAHLRRLFDCKNGKGVFRHLSSLHTLACYQGGEVPSIFIDKAYTEFFSKGGIDTSSLAGQMGLDLFCSPMWEDHGYAVCYIIEREKISFALSSKTQQMAKFIELLLQCLLEIGVLISQNAKLLPSRS